MPAAFLPPRRRVAWPLAAAAVLGCLTTLAWALASAGGADELARRYVELPAVQTAFAGFASVETVKSQILAVPGVREQLSPEQIAAMSTVLSEEFGAAMPEMMSIVARHAAAHFNEQELEAMIGFWGSPVGESIARKTGPFMAASAADAAQWGQTTASRAMHRLQTEH